MSTDASEGHEYIENCGELAHDHSTQVHQQAVQPTTLAHAMTQTNSRVEPFISKFAATPGSELPAYPRK